MVKYYHQYELKSLQAQKYNNFIKNVVGISSTTYDKKQFYARQENQVID
jgi:hypothetical protein